MSGPLLEVDSLRVQYGKRVAVNGLSLNLKAGEIVAMLGPNGAGKSTTLLAIGGALLPNGGAIRFAGHDLADGDLQLRAQIGFADQPPSLYEFFTVKEHLRFVGEARGECNDEAIDALLRELGLGNLATRLCRELSFGMRQRVGLAAALVGPVKLVLLDETLNGLDPRAAVQARDTVRKAADNGAAVLMSTHLLGVAERLCQRIVIMDQGELRADIEGDELDKLLEKGPGALEELYLSLVKEEEQPPIVDTGGES